MGLQSSIQLSVQSGFVALDDLLTTVTYTSVGDQDYDTEFSVVTSNNTDYSSVKFLIEDLGSREIESVNILRMIGDSDEILNTLKKCSIPTVNLTPTPKVNDKVTFSGNTWDVVAVETDPAEAAWNIYIQLT